MRLLRVHVVNFRCLRDLHITFDDVTVLVGANSTGKSTVLHALNWFFQGGPLSMEDVHGHQPSERVTIGVTFSDFDDADREALGAYVVGDEATFWRTWSMEHGEKLTGKGRSFPAFSTIRDQPRATEKRKAYNELRDTQPDLGLPKANSAAAVDEALQQWETEHPDQLQEGRTDATHLFGFAGQGRLASRMDFVLIPAVADPDAETRDARGTLLRQLLDRALGEQSGMRERLASLQERVSSELTDIMAAEGGAALESLSSAVTEQLSELVPGGEVLLSARDPEVKLPPLAVDLRVADDGLDTSVGRQGHGFQRALLIAVVQQLATAVAAQTDESAQASGAPPALVLALEEPELYQHPLQARHFAGTLTALAGRTEATIQVAYATHSEHFVDASQYERLRRFRRRPGAPWPESHVAQATVERVVARVEGVHKAEQIPLRVRMTLRRQVAEAVFAKAVVLVEGKSDVGLLQGLGDRIGGLDALGVAVVRCHGKRQLLIPWAILTELDVPCFVVFDGDAGLASRMQADGRQEADIQAAQASVGRDNALVLSTLGQPSAEQPATGVGDRCAVFADRLEAELASWPGFEAAVEAFKLEQGDFRPKPDDAYRHAAGTVAADPPQVLQDMLVRIEALAA
ncbi:ATP-dependent nuclease [Baekduia sp. Peel2402]|uniref:ATP-dependent nuclease n=1 Tax=Baekduia sp. Peel2402 TaxID=3458296 RepID=UPI00403EEB93